MNNDNTVLQLFWRPAAVSIWMEITGLSCLKYAEATYQEFNRFTKA